jgi:hypothetical protein
MKSAPSLWANWRLRPFVVASAVIAFFLTSCHEPRSSRAMPSAPHEAPRPDGEHLEASPPAAGALPALATPVEESRPEPPGCRALTAEVREGVVTLRTSDGESATIPESIWVAAHGDGFPFKGDWEHPRSAPGGAEVAAVYTSHMVLTGVICVGYRFDRSDLGATVMAGYEQLRESAEVRGGSTWCRFDFRWAKSAR